MDHLLAIDVETSGSDPFRHQILSLAIVPFYEPQNKLEIFIKHEAINWTETAKSFFGNYEKEWNTKAVNPFEASKKLIEYLALLPLSHYTLVGHNVGFDISFLKQLMYLANVEFPSKISHRSLDTFSLSYAAYEASKVPKVLKNSEELFSFFSELPDKANYHTAIADTLAVRNVFLKLVSLLRST